MGKTPVAEGIGFGGAEVPAIFGGGAHKVGHSLTKTNGLVNEWADVIGQVRQRWPYGLGHYLLTKTVRHAEGWSPFCWQERFQGRTVRLHQLSCHRSLQPSGRL